MTTLKHKALNTQTYTEASDWLVEFRSGDIDAAGRRAFYEWLRTSPEHMRAYLELAAIWNEGTALDPERKFDDAALLRDILAEGNVITVSAPAPNHAGPPTVAPHFFRHMLAASILVLVAGLSGWSYLQRGAYSTGTGEQLTIPLSDGSRIELNARSKVRVRFSSSERNIAILRGQAFFHVAKDPHRPLIVSSDATSVRAIGTQFDVYRKLDSTVVTVVEGQVMLSAAPASAETPASLALLAGEQAIVTEQKAVKQLQPDVEAAVAWTRGRLVFRATALAIVAEEFSRYSGKPLVIRDPALSDFRVTGSFSSANLSALIRFLESRPGVVVTYAEDEIAVSRADSVPSE